MSVTATSTAGGGPETRIEAQIAPEHRASSNKGILCREKRMSESLC